MRYKMMAALILTVMAVGACSDDSGLTDPAPIPEAALVRFINAAVDTGTVDLRFIDRIENLPTFLGVPFRGTSGMYQRVMPGTRAVRIFPNDTTPGGTSRRLVDTTVTLAAGSRYTFVYEGAARGNADRLVVINEPATLPTAPAGMIAIRVLHLERGRGAVDVQFAPSDTVVKHTAPDTALNPAPARTIYPKLATRITNVAYLTYSPYVNIPVLPTATPKDSLYFFFVQDAGSGTDAYSRLSVQRGATAPAGSTYGPQPGVQIPGSTLTAILFATATAGSPARVTATATPGIVVVPDKVMNP